MQFKTRDKVLRRPPLNKDNALMKFESGVSSTWTISWSATILWILISVAVPIVSCFIHLHKEWTVRVQDDNPKFWLRYNRSAVIASIGLSYAYPEDGKYVHFTPTNNYQILPLWSWETCRVLHTIGCALFCWSAAFALLGYIWFKTPYDQRFLSISVGKIQLLAAALHTMSLLLYPMVLGSSVAKMLCGRQAAAFLPGNCRMGWAYISAIVITAVSWHCPVLSRLTHHQQLVPRFKYHDVIVSIKSC